jgi:threonylcarbamoyladenosine tRNA methylthiotransferase MtaB
MPLTAQAPHAAAITNLGCKVNASEMGAAARLLRERGLQLVDDRAKADLYVINTCTVTAEADRKSRQAVRRARALNPSARIFATGCSVQMDPATFARIDPGATLIDNRSKGRLLDDLLEGLGQAAEDGRATDATRSGALASPMPTLSGVELESAADDRDTAERTRAFVKVQDGCSFFCTYCVIPAARGPERSLAPDEVLADVRRALRAGHREIVLTGINIGTYDGGWSERGPRGAHTRSALTLAGLVRRILQDTDVERVRLSSIEPQHVDDDLLAAWVGSGGRCLPHFHLPLQSGDDSVLRRMGRRYDAAGYARTIQKIRAAIHGVAIHADVIVGFPTEGEDAWQRSITFVRSMDFAGIHVFRYSERPGTAATRMAGRVPEEVRRRRAGELLALAAHARARFAARHLGGEAVVLFESELPDGRWIGHAEDHVLVAAEAPDATSLENTIGRVRLTGVDPDKADRLIGDVVALAGATSGG